MVFLTFHSKYQLMRDAAYLKQRFNFYIGPIDDDDFISADIILRNNEPFTFQHQVKISFPIFILDLYTLSHPENDRDVTERVQEYTLQDASFMRQSRCSFLNA